MKVTSTSNISIAFFLSIFLNTAFAQVCNKPVFTEGCNGSNAAIVQFSLSHLQGFEIYKNTSSTPCNNPLEVQASNTIALERNKAYTLKIKTSASSNLLIGFSFDGDNAFNNAASDVVYNFSTTGKNEFSQSFSIPPNFQILPNSVIKIRVVSSESPMINSDICGNTFIKGEIEEYVFGVKDCREQIDAGSNDTICSGNLIRLNGNGFPNATWSPIDLVEEPLNPKTLISSKLVQSSMLYYTALEPRSRCFYVDSLKIEVDPIIKDTAFIEDLLPNSKCPNPGASLQVKVSTPNFNPASYSYQWYSRKKGLLKGFVIQEYTAKESDSYYATVQYKKSCKTISTKDMVVQLLPENNFTISASTERLCKGGISILKPSISKPDYKYQWQYIPNYEEANKDTFNIDEGIFPELMVKSPGLYQLYVIDNNGCVSFDKTGGVNIKNAAKVEVKIPTQDSDGLSIDYTFCNNDSVEVNSKLTINLDGKVSDESEYPLTFQWRYDLSEVPLPGINNLRTYKAFENAPIKITASDAYGCKFESNLVYPSSSFYLEPFKILASTDCKGQNVKLSLNNNNPYNTYRWNYSGSDIDDDERIIGEQNSIKPLRLGVYQVVIESYDQSQIKSCFDTASYTVTSNTKIFEIDKSKSNFCEGEYYSFETNLSFLSEGTSWLNPLGKVSSGSFYSDTIMSGKYVVTTTIDDLNNNTFCVVKDSIVLNVLPKPKLEPLLNVVGDTILCPLDSVILKVETKDLKEIDHFGWYFNFEEFIYGNNTQTLTVKKTGEYTAIAKGINGCFSSYTNAREVVVLPKPKAASLILLAGNTESQVPWICKGKSTQLFYDIINGNSSYSLNILKDNKVVYQSTPRLTSGVYTIKEPGQYTIKTKVEDNDCTADTIINIKEFAPPISNTINDTIICSANPVKLINKYSPNLNYTWQSSNNLTIQNPNSIDAQVQIPQTFSGEMKLFLNLVDIQTLCQTKDTISLTILPNFNLFVNTFPPKCSGGIGSAKAIIGEGKAPFTFSWNDPLKQTKDSISLRSNIPYTLNVTDARGCSKSTSVIIREEITSNIKIEAIKVVSPSCLSKPDGTIEVKISGNTGTAYLSWENRPEFKNNKLINNLTGGQYILRVNDTASCREQVFQLTIPPSGNLRPGTISSGKTYVIGANIDIISELEPAIGNNISYQWQKNEATACQGTWVNIQGAEEKSYQPQNLTTSTCFRRTVYNSCDSVFSLPTSIIMIPPPADSISGSGSVGANIRLSINSNTNYPVNVLIRISSSIPNSNNIDTLIRINASPYIFSSRRAGQYKIIAVAGKNVEQTAIGVATIINTDNTVINAVLSGEVNLGQALNIQFLGNKNFPAKIIYNFLAENSSTPIVDSVIYPNALFQFIPTKTGTYTLVSIYDKDNKKGQATGASKVNTPKKQAFAKLQGGGEVGSIIKIITSSESIPAPWIVTLYLNDTLYKTLAINDSIYDFITEKSGRYHIRTVNGVDITNNSSSIQYITISSKSQNPATASIQGGGFVGSIIKITINPNNSSGPWTVELLLDEQLYKTLIINDKEYSFPSAKPGKYRIRAINGNNIGNGEAVFIIINPIPNLNEVFVWNAVSPNNDGKNDDFVIQIPLWLDTLGFKFDLAIFDREGTFLKKLESIDPLNLPFTASGDMLEFLWNCKNENNEFINPGTYFYSFKLNEKSSKSKPSKAQKDLANKSGFIEVKY
ncbi:MAG: hypothetical protein EAZ07_01780 [Cytophagales bacterium]|nr:MAG: hypothetical protein EAZ07_01780 [Cytophagales bacterium]